LNGRWGRQEGSAERRPGERGGGRLSLRLLIKGHKISLAGRARARARTQLRGKGMNRPSLWIREKTELSMKGGGEGCWVWRRADALPAMFGVGKGRLATPLGGRGVFSIPFPRNN